MMNNIRDWLCRRLGCAGIMTENNDQQKDKIEIIDKISEDIAHATHRIEGATIDLRIQKHALDSLMEDLRR